MSRLPQQPGTYTAVSTRAAGASASAHRAEGADGREPYTYVQIAAHIRTAEGSQASWSCVIDAPAASDLLALLAPVVERLRELAADELVATGSES